VVDDSLVIGDNKGIDTAISDMKKLGLILKVYESLKNYLSCEITFSPDKSKVWIHQPHLLTKLEGKFHEIVKDLQDYKTPGMPGLTILRNPENVTSVSSEKHALYRLGTGMLLYLAKYSHPDIANLVRELSKVLDCPTLAGFKEMLQIIKYILDSKNLALKIKPKKEDGEIAWKVLAFSNRDYAGDPE